MCLLKTCMMSTITPIPGFQKQLTQLSHLTTGFSASPNTCYTLLSVCNISDEIFLSHPRLGDSFLLL